MLDASAKLPSGILSGNANQYGDFDQCLSIRNPVRGKYCLASLDLSLKTNGDAILNELDSLIHSYHLVASNSTDVSTKVVLDVFFCANILVFLYIARSQSA